MIVIEPIAPMPTRPRYPGGIDLPILIPPSPPGSDVILQPKKTSSICFFGVLAGVVAAIAYAGSESPGSRLGAIHRKRRGNRLYYMYVPPGKWFEDAIAIPKKSLRDYKHRATYTPGQLYYIWAESADIARYLLRTDKGIREHSAYEAILDISPRPKPEPPKAKRLTKAEQLTLFGSADTQAWQLTRQEYTDLVNRIPLKSDIDPDAGKIRFKLKMAKGKVEKARQAWDRARVYSSIERAQKQFDKSSKEVAELQAQYDRIGESTEDIAHKIADEYPLVFSKRADFPWVTIPSHESAVKAALDADLPVPARVLTDYPKLKGQLTLFSGNPLSGATANCLLWQEVEGGKRGGLLWRCAKYGPSCDGSSCLPEKYKFQTRTCVRTKKVPALAPRWKQKTVTRCAEYQRVCSTAACLEKAFDKPAASPGHGLNVNRMIRDMARQMAEDRNTDEEIAGKALGREIVDRGGIRQYRKGREKEEFKVIPLFMRRKEGLPPDEMASEMGFRDDSELFAAISKEYPGTKKTKRTYSADDFMLDAEGVVWSAIDQGLIHGLGQDLFPELRRELVLEPAEDIATSDDPVTACMERLGWKIPRMNELKASIGWKLTPDLFTGKTEKLSSGEKEYQRVISECLEARSGTAGALGARRYSIAAQAVQASQRDTRAMSMYLTNHGITVNEDQTVTLYHGTTEKSAEEIVKDGKIKGTAGKNVREHIQNAAWLTPDKEFVKIWGDKILTMRVPVKYLRHLAQNFKEFYFEGGLKKDVHRKGEWIPENYPRENWVIKVARADYDFYIKEPRRLLGARRQRWQLAATL